ncbi:serine-aspartate repeat-containing protein I [Ixodes scapularis]
MTNQCTGETVNGFLVTEVESCTKAYNKDSLYALPRRKMEHLARIHILKMVHARMEIASLHLVKCRQYSTKHVRSAYNESVNHVGSLKSAHRDTKTRTGYKPQVSMRLQFSAVFLCSVVLTVLQVTTVSSAPATKCKKSTNPGFFKWKLAANTCQYLCEGWPTRFENEDNGTPCVAVGSLKSAHRDTKTRTGYKPPVSMRLHFSAAFLCSVVLTVLQVTTVSSAPATKCKKSTNPGFFKWKLAANTCQYLCEGWPTRFENEDNGTPCVKMIFPGECTNHNGNSKYYRSRNYCTRSRSKTGRRWPLPMFTRYGGRCTSWFSGASTFR